MRKSVYAILITILINVLSNAGYSQCANPANIYTFTYNGHTYEVVKELKTWNDAKTCAQERGGYLVAIDNADEKNYLMGALMMGTAANISANYHPVDDGGGASYIWTGGSDAITEGVWYWQGSPLVSPFYTGQGTAGSGGGSAVGGAYVNWGDVNGSEPDNFYYLHDQDALGIAMDSWPHGVAGQWNDIDATNTLYFIIEKDGSSTSCVTPSTLTANNITSNSANISWVSSAPNFSIKYKVTSGSSWTTVSSSTNGILLSDLLPNTSYDVQTKAICSSSPSDTSAWSSTANFTTQNNVMVAQNNTINYKVYPNPANNCLFIEGADELINSSIQILNMNGMIVKNYTLFDKIMNRIAIDDLSNGVYLLKIVSKNHNFIQRFVKQ